MLISSSRYLKVYVIERLLYLHIYAILCQLKMSQAERQFSDE